MNPLTSGNEIMPQRCNIIWTMLLIINKIQHKHTPRKCQEKSGFSNSYPAFLRKRLCSPRQNSYRGFSAFSFTWSFGFRSMTCLSSGGFAACSTSSAPYRKNHSASIASARASTHSSAICSMCLRLRELLLNCATMKVLRDSCETSSRYLSGGSSESIRPMPPFEFRYVCEVLPAGLSVYFATT